ncbi:MAG: cobalt-precorrin-4/precorrin-4 C(11)-methyltransferase [Deltaproteobacteria bacterium]|jgi:precorrin-4/cobalt-precorrin-4 C11-methyltransferase|nr:cobalt-precorrin-4/precorrin-4 C(11)-methyltransferase [Deltaproteobacteria bacterium]
MEQNETTGKVWFIGAGPGDPELLTVKGRRLIRQASLVLYAGSLVPPAVVAEARPEARLIDSAPLHLEETHTLMREAARRGETVARVHTGDPGLYGALREQAALLARDNIPYEVVPGVSAAFAAAAAAGLSLTVPEKTQCFSITRLAGRTPVPAGQGVRELAAHGGSLAVYLSGADRRQLARELRAAGLPGGTAIVAAYRVGWPEERLIRLNLAELDPDGLELEPEAAARLDGQLGELDKLARQITFLVLPGESGTDGTPPSRLYDRNFSHGFRAAQDKK